MHIELFWTSAIAKAAIEESVRVASKKIREERETYHPTSRMAEGEVDRAAKYAVEHFYKYFVLAALPQDDGGDDL